MSRTNICLQQRACLQNNTLTDNFIMKFLDDITSNMKDAIAEAKCEGRESAYITHNITNGYIDIWCNYRDDVEIVICQNNKDKEYPLLENAIFNAIPTWESVEVEIDNSDPYSYWAKYCGRI